MDGLKVVLDTDVIAAFLGAGSEARPSLMRRLLGTCFCYTTVFNAIELFAAARTLEEESAVQSALGCIKLLGLNARGARNYAPLLRQMRRREAGDLPALIGGLSRESRLPLVTQRVRAFEGIDGLVVVPAGELSKVTSADEIRRVIAMRRGKRG